MSNRFMRRQDGTTGSIPQDIVWVFKYDAAANFTTLLSPQWCADNDYEFVGSRLTFSTASTSGTIVVEKCTGTTAAGSGTALTTASATSGAANTVVAAALAGTQANRRFTAGDRMTFKVAGTVTNIANLSVTVYFKKVQTGGSDR